MKYKILTMCAGGLVRSVSAKFILTYTYGHDVIACGQDSNTNETREYLYKWADYIIVMSEEYRKFVPDIYKDKTFIYEVGPDIYGYAFHPNLQKLVNDKIVEHGLFVTK